MATTLDRTMSSSRGTLVGDVIRIAVIAFVFAIVTATIGLARTTYKRASIAGLRTSSSFAWVPWRVRSLIRGRRRARPSRNRDPAPAGARNAREIGRAHVW